jgi:hypothetical protein
MKIFMLVLLGLGLAACSNFDNHRSLSSLNSLEGNYLGYGNYKVKSFRGKRLGKPKMPAIRLYLDEVPGEQDSYYAVILEHVGLLSMAPQYIASSKLPVVNKLIGYLKNITERISVYKVTRGSQIGTYEMHRLKVVGNDIQLIKTVKPSLLVLSDDKNLSHPLEGAMITDSKNGEPVRIKFPSKSDKRNGMQYSLAKKIYDGTGLESTWRKKFLPGPYLAAYGNRKDVVLQLNRSGSRNRGLFTINKKKAKRYNKKQREAQFTNAKSAYISGDYKVTEPIDGMFLFRPYSGKSHKYVQGRIGLFIDIFDATKALGQDVVELALINPSDPSDFLMYYEDPENGEGN